jgi:hypothetical protein
MKVMRTILLTLAASVALGGVALSQDQTAHTYQKTAVTPSDLWISPITRLQQDLGITVGERMKLSGLLVNVFATRQQPEATSTSRTEGDRLPNTQYDITPAPAFNDSAIRRPHLVLLRLSW